MDAQHTPGPWVSAYDDGGITPDPSTGNRMFDIARIYWPDKVGEAEYRANARLIAAAPDLLAALRAMDAELTNGSDFAAWERAKAAMRAAIAKATT